jgi:hypothetical protein
MTLWRVFGLLDKFEDQPRPYWSASAAGPQPNSDRFTVIIGEVPEKLLTSLKQWRAQTRSLLNMMTGQAMSPEELLASYKVDLEIVDTPEFDEPYVAWLTLRLDRSTQVMPTGAAELGWFADSEKVISSMESFAVEGDNFMGCALARVMGAAKGLSVRRLRYASRSPYLTAVGRAAFTIPRTEMKIRDSGIIVGRNDGWRSAPSEQIRAAINAIPATRVAYKSIGQPTSWLCSAMAETEDNLRRFTFAYGGLELLATRTEKASRESLIAIIERADNKLPVVELLWPGVNENFALRNTVFRFAALAALYSPDTALADVQTFKQIAKARNDFYHGTEQTVTVTLARDCEELLQKYVGLVAAGPPGSGVAT